MRARATAVTTDRLSQLEKTSRITRRDPRYDGRSRRTGFGIGSAVDVQLPPAGYHAFDEPGLRRYLSGLPHVADRLGGSPADWNIREVGDGNLNLVFLVNGRSGGVCVKQSLPHVRAVQSWQLPVERTFFEYSYYRIVGPLVGSMVPQIFHYEPELFALVMEQLVPHIILRRGLLNGNHYAHVARDVAEYVARATFFTSDLGQRFEPKMDGVALFAKNHGLLRITTDLVFTDPYHLVERNAWTSPALDSIAAEFRADGALKVAAGRLAHTFLSNAQALIHGDLHTGSVMVTADETRIIDPEFALYGPIGFDLGAFIGNLLISYFSQPGYATTQQSRTDFGEWILTQIVDFWEHFQARFRELWRTHAAGDAYPPQLFCDAGSLAALHVEQQRVIDRLYADTIGFASVKMIRRILGFAKVIDFLEIADVTTRAACERLTLEFARDMLVWPERFGAIADVVDAARERAHRLPL